MTSDNDGIPVFNDRTDIHLDDGRRLVKVGKIILERGSQFSISMDEKALPDGKKDLYILVASSQPYSATDCRDDGCYPPSYFQSGKG